MTDLLPTELSAAAQGTPLERFGAARHPDREAARQRPDGVSADAVQALGTLSKALEYVENARGSLYAFHQVSGTADLTLQSAVKELRDAGLDDVADQVEKVLVGRDVVKDMWTYQIVDSYDEQYYSAFKATEAWARAQAAEMPKHVFEAEMKRCEQGGE